MNNTQISEGEHKNYANSIEIWTPKASFAEYLKKGGFTSIISGSRAAGKSEMLRYLIANPKCGIGKYFNTVVVFSKTLVNGFYQSFINSQLMFSEYNPEIIGMLKGYFQKFKDEGKKFRFLVIFDDIISGKIKYDDSIGDLFYTGRHFGCSVIFLTQKLSCLATGWVANTNIFICMFSGSRNEKEYVNNKLIMDNIYNKFPNSTKKETEHIGYLTISQICKDYWALIIEPYNYDDPVHKFRAELTKKKPVRGFTLDILN